LAKFTFETEFLPLTRPEAIAILSYQETRFSGRKTLKGEHVTLLRSLERRIDAVVKQHFPDGAFLRLCGRSPKEVCDPFCCQRRPLTMLSCRRGFRGIVKP
jgi:hypothetical protein